MYSGCCLVVGTTAQLSVGSAKELSPACKCLSKNVWTNSCLSLSSFPSSLIEPLYSMLVHYLESWGFVFFFPSTCGNLSVSFRITACSTCSHQAFAHKQSCSLHLQRYPIRSNNTCESREEVCARKKQGTDPPARSNIIIKRKTWLPQ